MLEVEHLKSRVFEAVAAWSSGLGKLSKHACPTQGHGRLGPPSWAKFFWTVVWEVAR